MATGAQTPGAQAHTTPTTPCPKESLLSVTSLPPVSRSRSRVTLRASYNALGEHGRTVGPAQSGDNPDSAKGHAAFEVAHLACRRTSKLAVPSL